MHERQPHFSDGIVRNYMRSIQRQMRWTEQRGHFGKFGRSPFAHLKKPKGGKLHQWGNVRQNVTLFKHCVSQGGPE